MGLFAEQIKSLKLVRLLEESAGRDDILGTDVAKLHAMVLDVADTIGPLLARIPVTFRQYTEHDLGHSANLIKLMGDFIPAATQASLNALELAVLILAALLHDLGMFVDDAERNRFLESTDFKRFLNAAPDKARAIEEARATGKHVTARAIEDAVLADYFRRRHPERARQRIEELPNALVFRDYPLTDAVARICESHGWGVYESTDPLHPEKTIARLNPRERIFSVPFNEQYIAAALRLADIMDFDRSRTPLSVLKTIDFTEAKSQAEWQKHLAIKGFEVTDRDVAYQAECMKAEHYVAVMEFLDWIDAELRDCRRLLVRQAPKDVAERYQFQLPPATDRIHVEMADKSFIAGAFHFELDYERIMKLLMDRSLYPDPSLFLRELLQNSLDACRVRTAMAKSEGMSDAYKPRIAVWDGSKEPNPTIIFQDNGVGMSRATISNYFMRVGRSYYTSNEFHAIRQELLEQGIELEATSQFGIGFLSCFMVADRIEVETYRSGHEALRVEIEGPTKYFTIQVVDPPPRPAFRVQGPTDETDGPPCYPGTRVTVHLRPAVEVKVAETLHTFAVNVDAPVAVYEAKTRLEIPSFNWSGDPMRFVSELVKDEQVETWSTLLQPLRIPLEEYDFCEGLDGSAWLWMLRGTDGRPSPVRGWLRVYEHGVEPWGLPSLKTLVQDHRFDLKILKTLEDVSVPTEEALYAWNQADRDTRRKIVEHVERTKIDRTYWTDVRGAAEALADGGDRWMELPASYGTLPMSTTPGQLALHGISLPRAITHWNPMTGRSDATTVLDFPAGFLIDVRKRVPTPAANRLFIVPRDGARIGVPLTRAFIRCVLDLADAHASEDHWLNWCEGFFTTLGRSFWFKHAVRPEYDRIARLARVCADLPGEPFIGTVHELRKKFGRFIPATNEHGKALTLLEANDVLFSKYEIIASDGEKFYDLDSEAELPPIE